VAPLGIRASRQPLGGGWAANQLKAPREAGAEDEAEPRPDSEPPAEDT
jgi:hypothetical protein